MIVPRSASQHLPLHRLKVEGFFLRPARSLEGGRRAPKRGVVGNPPRAHDPLMKSAYELAMERLNQQSPLTRLNPEQKKELAEIDNRYAAKIAERETLLQGDIAKAEAAGDPQAMDEARRMLAEDRRKLEAEREDRKEAVRQG